MRKEFWLFWPVMRVRPYDYRNIICWIISWTARFQMLTPWWRVLIEKIYSQKRHYSESLRFWCVISTLHNTRQRTGREKPCVEPISVVCVLRELGGSAAHIYCVPRHVGAMDIAKEKQKKGNNCGGSVEKSMQMHAANNPLISADALQNMYVWEGTILITFLYFPLRLSIKIRYSDVN